VIGEPGWEIRPGGVQLGVIVPDSSVPTSAEGRCSASDTARRSMFIVPSALVLPERAEQTIAILCCERYSRISRHYFTGDISSKLAHACSAMPLDEPGHYGSMLF
jgi:hypothetical protein